MVRNNQSDYRKKLAELLRREDSSDNRDILSQVLGYGRLIAKIENALVVVSDMVADKSHILAGGFARNLDLGDYQHENSIWENKILSLMSPEEQEEKYLAELQFFHYLRRIPKSRKEEYYLVSKLRFRFVDEEVHDVLHRMYYIYDEDKENVRYAVCIYGPMPFEFNGKSYVVNSVTGLTEELSVSDNSSILSPRECQVLSLIDTGLRSLQIADRLNISIHTVNRHRQDIISRLRVKNTHEACRIAKSIKII